MNIIKRKALQFLSFSSVNIKKIYKLHRKVLNIFNPYIKPLKPLYNLLDYKIFIEGREIPVRVFKPRKQEYCKVLIFFHGGGWVTGNIDSYTNACSYMARHTKHTVVAVDYSLAPENPFPIGLHDCYEVTRVLYENPHLLQCKTEDITLIGDSAGGNLASAVSLMAKDRGEFKINKQILIYPSTYYDHSEKSPFPSIHENGENYIMTSKRLEEYMDLYVPDKNKRKDPYVAPLLAQDLKDQPKTLIITAEFDPLRDEGESYGARLINFGNSVKIYRLKGALHGFFSLPWKSKYVKKSYKIINLFLKDKI